MLTPCIDSHKKTFCDLPGGSLYGLLHCPSAVLTWRDVASILRQAAAGMAHLHRHGVLHRDLKSANLLLAEHGAVRVADFGLARLCGGGGGPASTALTGGLGTFQFMAPEVLANQRYSSKADVYAFGVVRFGC
jgi:serine/threonine protein kinase